MPVSALLVVIIAFFSMFVPGVLFALALLRKTELHIFEVLVIGFFFGLLAPATMTWIEAYFITSIHAFTFSLGLFETNAVILSIVAAALAYQQGVFDDIKKTYSKIARKNEARAEISQIEAAESDYTQRLSLTRKRLRQFEAAKSLISKHIDEENELARKHANEKRVLSNFTEDERNQAIKLHMEEEAKLAASHEKEESILLKDLENSSTAKQKRKIPLEANKWVWIILLAIMLLTFATRMMSYVITPNFFEFDPYFDMLDARAILTYGYQPYLTHGAWPIVNGTVTRVQPLIPYLEAYWYSLANYLGPKSTHFSTALMSYVGGVYPPITAALLVFVIFMLLYHEYDYYIGLTGAALTATMPILFTTFVSGEQLLEPWGILTLFFFFATYLLAVRNMKSKRLAILAGIAYAFTFLGAHYYTVDTGVLTLYIIIQGVVGTLRNGISKDFYKMNLIVLAVIVIFLAAYYPYHATLSGRIPTVLHIPITIMGPALALLLVFIFQYMPVFLQKNKLIFKKIDLAERLYWLVFLVIILALLLALTPLGKPLSAYINLSAKFTTPSTPLFMTVEEFIPTGLLYNFGSGGFGIIGTDVFGLPILVWMIMFIGVALILISIIYRRSQSGIFYLAIILPLAVAGFSEVKYIPHFGTAYILLIGIIIGELTILAGNDFKLKMSDSNDKESYLNEKIKAYENAYSNHSGFMKVMFSIVFFFISSVLSIAFVLYMLLWKIIPAKQTKGFWALLVIFVLAVLASAIFSAPILGESGTITQAISSASLYYSNPAGACSTISRTSSIGADLYCNTVPPYWLAATAWMRSNVGPSGPRILSWWDYGDWINWFGNSHTVTRGDNSEPQEDQAVAAGFVLSPNDSYGPSALSNMMNTNQTKYVVFDQGLIQKWGALDFLGCVYINGTSRNFAIAEGKAQNPPVPYALGNSQCEIAHDPEYALVPLSAIIPSSSSSQSISSFCSISNSTTEYASSYLVIGNSLVNQTVCAGISNVTAQGTVRMYSTNGTKLNAYIAGDNPLGELTGPNNQPYLEYLMVYTPNGSNSTITDAPSLFYRSNFYKGFILGSLPGFKQVYPSNATGINYINGTYPIRIFALDNFTGSLPPQTPKPSYVHNSYQMPY